MASSSEAFAKFEIWRKSKTPLKVTVIERGKPADVGFGRIASLDAEEGLVAVAIDALRAFATFNRRNGKADFASS